MVMKMNEKLVALAVATSMVVPTIMPIMAEDINGTSSTETTDSVTAKYNVTEGYTWTIHNDIEFTDSNSSPTGEVKVTSNVIPDGKKLKITVKGNGGGDKTTDLTDTSFTIKNGTKTLSYTVKKGENNINTEGEVLSVEAGTANGDATLTFTLGNVSGGSAKVSGDYTGKVIYTASVVDSTN